MDRFAIAASLREVALLTSLKGENRFKARAYDRAAETLERLPGDLGTLVEENRLEEVENIGKSIAAIVEELWRQGRSRALDKLREEVPPGMIELSRLGIGEQKLRALHTELGVDSLDTLRAALAAGRVRTVKGFGPKTEERVRAALERYETNADRLVLGDAMVLGERLLRHVRADPGARAELAGEVRRRSDSAGEIELVATGTSAERFAAYNEVVRVEEGGTVRLANGTRARLTLVPPDQLGAGLILRTGSAEHVAALEAEAKARGTSLARLTGDEAEVYAALGLPFIPPEVREDGSEIAAARAGDDFSDLLADADLRGAVHCHTVYSDGRATIEEMALAADVLGLEYLTITDHSASAFYARGLEVDRLKQQWDEIAEVQERVKVKLLRGTESDILAAGELDYPDEILEQLDVVIASIHSRFKMNEDAMTERIIRALKHPLFKIWGHALGRLVLKREPIACRMEEILDVMAESRAALEVTGDPDRLEPEPRWIRAARARGIKLVLSSDAHSTRALQNAHLGVAIARRGGVRRSEVLNTLPFERFKDEIRPC